MSKHRNWQGGWQQTFDGIGLCQQKKCVTNGPRCVEGYCQECCKKEHEKQHSPPAKVGEFAPEARCVYRREFTV